MKKHFDTLMEVNTGKSLNLTYDKRKTLNPMVLYSNAVVIDTLPFGQIEKNLYKFAAAAMELACEKYVIFLD